MLPRDKSEIDEQLEAIKTPLDKIDFLEVLSHELRNKIDWMKRKEARKRASQQSRTIQLSGGLVCGEACK